MLQSDNAGTHTESNSIGQPRELGLQLIALVHAFKGGYAAATLIAVYGGSR